ncbi:hypothetical protein VNI00_001200 [Paramarasmius palmivorus]|uniref:AB hydrolase-1 domain-containing protein n=1 Tax=Paramarasmius palmivorus TaxID=297713 RepID=A0AAW0EAY7_9AGAR
MKAALLLLSLTSKSFAMKSGAIVVDDQKQTTLAFEDSGPPKNSSYTTIFAIHGLSYTSGIWSRVAAVGQKQGLRIVGINRRGYQGSTPFSAAEIAICTNGTDEQKTQFVRDRGVEIATFIDKFIQENGIPQISTDGKKGGFAILGWSAGASFATAAIASIDSLPSDAQSRLSPNLRAHIAQEPASISYGQTPPPLTWSPQIDTSIPENTRLPVFKSWITSFFNHGDLSTRNVDVLEYVVPSTIQTPVIFDMTQSEQDSFIDPSNEDTFETPFVLNSLPQLNAVYKKAYFDKANKERFPRLKTTFITGDHTASFSIAALWVTEDDNKANGGDANFVVVPGGNHFLHWAQPEKAVSLYLQALS